jgi:hypothetical protein
MTITSTASRDSTFRILHAASLFEIEQRKQRSSTREHAFLNRLFIELAVFPFILSMFLAAVVYFTNSSWLIESSIVALLIAYIGVLVHPLISAWFHRKSIREILKHPFGILLRNSAATAAVDLKYLPKLVRKPLRLLEVVALEVKAEREFFERRISLLVGAIEKVGLAPGMLATFLSLHKLPDGLSPWIAGLAYATPALYFFAVLAYFLVMRLDRMNKLVDLAITHRKAQETASPLIRRRCVKKPRSAGDFKR